MFLNWKDFSERHCKGYPRQNYTYIYKAFVTLPLIFETLPQRGSLKYSIVNHKFNVVSSSKISRFMILYSNKTGFVVLQNKTQQCHFYVPFKCNACFFRCNWWFFFIKKKNWYLTLKTWNTNGTRSNPVTAHKKSLIGNE